jgi:DNA-binding MarR family transcriptional regulator
VSEHPAEPVRGPYGVPAWRAGWDSVDRVLDDWARERPDLDFTPVGVLSRLEKVRTHIDSELIAVFAEHGLTAADFTVIVTLRRSGAPYRMPQARLMDALELTSGTVSVRLDRLEKGGIVTRGPDPENGRGAIVQLTRTGVALFDVVAPAHLANEDRLLSALSVPERQALADLLRRLLSSYETQHTGVAEHLGLQLESAPVARRRRQAVGLLDASGLLVAAVRPGSPADAAGIARGDLIVEIDGRPVLSTVTLAELLEAAAAGQLLSVGVLRGDRRRTLRVTAVAATTATHDPAQLRT